MKSIKKNLLISFLILIFLAPTTHAFYFDAKEGVVIQKTIPQDAYLAGKSVYIEQNIEGDAFAAGESLMVNGAVEQDVMLAGQNITINGPTGDDLRLAGEKLNLNTSIEGDLIAAGSEINMSEKTKVKGDALIFGKNLNIEGEIKGDLRSGAEKLYLNATVEGNVKLSYVNEIILGPNAKIEGDLVYSSPSKNENLEKITTGKITYKAENWNTESKMETKNLMNGMWVYGLMSRLFFGLLLFWAFHYFALHLSQKAYNEPLKSLGFGMLGLFALPFIALAFAVSFIGLPISGMLMAGWLVLLYVGKICAGILIGGKIIAIDSKSSLLRIYGSFALGTFIFSLIDLIPYGGGAVNFILVLIGVGALILYKYELMVELRKKKLA